MSKIILEALNNLKNINDDIKNKIKENLSSEDNISVKDVLKQIIDKFGNKKNKYRLTASSYETSRYYTKTFYAPNDYLALFSMVLHGAPSIANFEDWGQGSDLLDYFNEYPEYLELLTMASINWWGDGDDYIIALENLTTGKTLYAGDDDYTYSKNDNFDSYDNDYDFEKKLNIKENKDIEKSITEENESLTKEEQKELGYLKRKERVTPLDKEERYRLMELSKKATNFINKKENK